MQVVPPAEHGVAVACRPLECEPECEIVVDGIAHQQRRHLRRFVDDRHSLIRRGGPGERHRAGTSLKRKRTAALRGNGYLGQVDAAERKGVLVSNAAARRNRVAH